MTWSQFRKAHGSVFAAADFFTIEAWMIQVGKNLTEPVAVRRPLG